MEKKKAQMRVEERDRRAEELQNQMFAGIPTEEIVEEEPKEDEENSDEEGSENSEESKDEESKEDSEEKKDDEEDELDPSDLFKNL